MYSPYFKIRHCFKICFCVKFSSTVVTFSVIHTKQLIATVKTQDTFYSRNVLWWHQRHFTLHFHLTWWDRTQHIKVLTCTKISWITNLIPKVGQWHGEKVSLSRYFFLVYELNDAPPNHFWVCSCLVSPFRNTVKFSRPMSYKILIQHGHCLDNLGKSNNQGQCRHNVSKDISVEQSLLPLLDHLASSLRKSNEAKLPNPSRALSESNISSSRSWRSNKCLIFSVRSLWSEASSSSICEQRCGQYFRQDSFHFITTSSQFDQLWPNLSYELQRLINNKKYTKKQLTFCSKWARRKDAFCSNFCNSRSCWASICALVLFW